MSYENNDNKTTIIVIIIFVFLLVVGISLLIYYHDKIFTDNSEKEVPKVKVLLLALDDKDGSRIDANYVVGWRYRDENKNIQFKEYQRGNLSKLFYTEIYYPIDQELIMYAWSDQYSLSKKVSIVPPFEGLIFDKSLVKYATLNITKDGDLKQGKNILNLNINAQDGIIEYLSICLDYSLSVLDANLESLKGICDTGWDNCYEYDVNDTTKCIDRLLENQYICRNTMMISPCSSLGDSNKTCYLSVKIPTRLNNKVYKCGTTGLSYSSFTQPSNVTIKIEYDLSQYSTCDDYLDVYIYDRQQVMGTQSWGYEDPQGNDVAMKDFIYRIKKEGC